jgi:NAD(P)-dependent dehydrogenase (short-subunit alcohol dehydrogenase family)
VVLAGRKTDQLAKVEKETKALATDASAKIISVSVDITIVSEVQNLYTQIQKTFGRPADILINNAGSSGIAAPMGQIPWDDFTNVFGTHFLGTALMIKYFISTQQTPADPVGTIIYITSGLGSMLMPGFSAYAIAKLAGQRLTEYLDTEYPHLRAFTLSPGLIKTGLTHSSFEPFTKDHVELPGMMTLYLAQERANFLKGGFVGVNWDVKEIEANKGEIVEKKLLKMQWIAAKLGEGGHPFVT